MVTLLPLLMPLKHVVMLVVVNIPVYVAKASTEVTSG
jgi:hypothetical protein